MIELIVVLLEFYLPGCCVWADFVGFTPISEVTVVSPNNDRDRCASKQM